MPTAEKFSEDTDSIAECADRAIYRFFRNYFLIQYILHFVSFSSTLKFNVMRFGCKTASRGKFCTSFDEKFCEKVHF